MRIIGPPSIGDLNVVLDRLTVEGATTQFRFELAPLMWAAGSEYVIDPVGMIAQSFLETGAGKFGGRVQPKFYNPAGIKIRHMELIPGVTDGDNPLSHTMFPNWQVGVRAQAQHLRAYAGWDIDGEIVDPRYLFVIGKHRCERFSELGGKWAPSLAYGDRIEAIMRRLGVV